MATSVPRRRRWPSRRSWLGGIGIGVAGVGAGFIYRAAPSFWQQYAREIGEPIEAPPRKPGIVHWKPSGIHAAWLGHATALISIDGFRILTDPVFSMRVGLNLGPLTLGLKRMVEPALTLDELPRIDLILLSHAHMDHFDLPSLRALESRRPHVVTARNTADLLRAERYAGVDEVGWDEEVRVGPVTVRGLRVNHWGARMRTDVHRGYNGYLIRAGRYRVLFGGDTAYTTGFRSVGGADLALMPVGAYNPWIRYHCNPEEAWRMANDARADLFLPLHHRTFHLSREPLGEPVERLLQAAGSSHHHRIPTHTIGGELYFS